MSLLLILVFIILKVLIFEPKHYFINFFFIDIEPSNYSHYNSILMQELWLVPVADPDRDNEAQILKIPKNLLEFFLLNIFS